MYHQLRRFNGLQFVHDVFICLVILTINTSDVLEHHYLTGPRTGDGM